MKRFFVLMLVAMCAFPAQGILVDAVNDSASKALAETLPCMGCAAGWDNESGTRYSAGSCILIRNNPTDGAWVLTARHAVYRTQTGGTFNFLRYTFQPSYYDGFPKGSTGYSTTCTVAALRDKVFYHSSQDIALVKLEHLVYNTSGTLVAPMELNTTVSLVLDQAVLFGGSGETGIPSQGGVGGTSYRDGYRRCVRGRYRFMVGTVGTMDFIRTLSLPGIGCNADSGGFAAIEYNGTPLLCGVLVTVSGSGEGTLTSFEHLGQALVTWVTATISQNGNTSAVTDWQEYE